MLFRWLEVTQTVCDAPTFLTTVLAGSGMSMVLIHLATMGFQICTFSCGACTHACWDSLFTHSLHGIGQLWLMCSLGLMFYSLGIAHSGHGTCMSFLSVVFTGSHTPLWCLHPPGWGVEEITPGTRVCREQICQAQTGELEESCLAHAATTLGIWSMLIRSQGCCTKPLLYSSGSSK